MATNREIRLDPIVTTRKVANEVQVDRELDLLRREEMLQVSCITGNRHCSRRITVGATEFTDRELHNLARMLREFIETEIRG